MPTEWAGERGEGLVDVHWHMHPIRNCTTFAEWPEVEGSNVAPVHLGIRSKIVISFFPNFAFPGGMASRTLFKHMFVSAASLQGKRDHQEDRWSVDAANEEDGTRAAVQFRCVKLGSRVVVVIVVVGCLL